MMSLGGTGSGLPASPHPLLYRHYRTKQSLFHELVDDALAGMRRIVDLFQSDGSPAQFIAQFVDEIYNDMATSEDFANLLILMTQSCLSGEETVSKQKEILQLNSQLLDAAARLIEKGQKLGEFRAGNPHELAVFFFSTIHGLANLKVTMKQQFTLPSSSLLTAILCKKENDLLHLIHFQL